MIYINARFLTQQITGVQRFAIEISKYLKKILADEVQFISPYNVLDKQLAGLLENKIIGRNTGHRWEQMDLPNFLQKNQKPLLLNLTNTAPMFYKNQIVTHHDIAYIRFPQSFSLSFRLAYKIIIPRMLRNSKKLITVSNFSKKELLDFYKYPDDKIHVINNAVSTQFINNGEKYIDNNRYILAVSSNAYHKNFNRMIEAYESLPKNLNVKLLIVGSKSNVSFSSVEKKHTENVIFLGRVSDQELSVLYRNALAFVFPSIYEGFGIPPLEAQACGCPVIASDKASMTEILKDSAYYFDPYDVSSIAQSMIKIIEDEKLRKDFIKKGLLNVSNYSWEKSAEKVLKLLKSYE